MKRKPNPPALPDFTELARKLLRYYDPERITNFLVRLNHAGAKGDLAMISALRAAAKGKWLRLICEAVSEFCAAGDNVTAANIACGIAYRIAEEDAVGIGVDYFSERQAVIMGLTHRRRIIIPRMDNPRSRLVWDFRTTEGEQRIEVGFIGKVGKYGQICRVKVWDGGRVVSTLEVEDVNRESEVANESE